MKGYKTAKKKDSLPPGFRNKNNNYEYRTVYKRKHLSVSGSTIQECYEKMLKRKEKVDQGIISKDMTFENYVNQWMKTRETSIKSSTLRKEESQIKMLMVVPVTDGRLLKDVKLSELNNTMILLVRAQYNIGRKATTTNNAISLLSKILKQAYKDRIIDYNPASNIKYIKYQHDEKICHETIHRKLSDDELNLFFNSLDKNNYYKPLFSFALHTGMRMGEIGALTEHDITNKYINVSKGITRNNMGITYLSDTPKTQSSIRKVPINTAINKDLKEQRKQLKKLNKKGVKNKYNLVFPSSSGNYLRDSINRVIKQTCKKAGINPFTFHAFRHTFGSKGVVCMGVAPTSKILGHSDIRMTNKYVHSYDEDNYIAMQKMF